MIACGFELGMSEVSTWNIASIETSSPYLTEHYGLIQPNGYLTWTFSDTYTGTISAHVHTKLINGYNSTPLKITRGAHGFDVTVVYDATRETYWTVNVNYDGSLHATFKIEKSRNSWISIAMVLGYKILDVYIDGILLYSDVEVHTGASGTITELRATCGGSSTAISVDDIALWHGVYESQLVLVQPYIPYIDRSTGLLPNVSTQYNWQCVDEYDADSDTYVYQTNTTTAHSDLYYGKIPDPPYGMVLTKVLSMSVLTQCKTIYDTDNEFSYGGFCVGDAYSSEWSASHNMTTSYPEVIDTFESAGAAGAFKAEWFSGNNYSQRMMIGVKMIASRLIDEVRCTKVRASLLCFYYKDENKGQASGLHLTGGFDLTMTIDTTSFVSGNYFRIITNLASVPIGIPADDITDTQTAIAFIYEPGLTPAGIYVRLETYPIEKMYTEYIYIGPRDQHKLRVVLHDEFVSVFDSDRCMYTFSMSKVDYPSTLEVSLLSDRGISVEDLTVSELSDWREATYIDMQSSIASGISSVIQQRPIEIVPLNGGIVDFSYNRTRESVKIWNIYRHTIQLQNNSQAGSHYIVNYRDVAVYTDTGFMDEGGYATRVLQLSELDSGAIKAAQMIAERAREQQETHSIECAPDIRPEPGDIVEIAYTISGTKRNMSYSIIVESITMSLEEGAYSMQIGGRKDV